MKINMGIYEKRKKLPQIKKPRLGLGSYIQETIPMFRENPHTQ